MLAFPCTAFRKVGWSVGVRPIFGPFEVIIVLCMAHPEINSNRPAAIADHQSLDHA